MLTPKRTDELHAEIQGIVPMSRCYKVHENDGYWCDGSARAYAVDDRPQHTANQTGKPMKPDMVTYSMALRPCTVKWLDDEEYIKD